MLERLLELMPFCIDHANTNALLKLSVNEWTSIENLVKSLTPVREASLSLQRQDITLGDFYCTWLQTQNKLKNIDSTVSNSIYQIMMVRQKLLLKNELFSAAIYLDPRFQVLLDYSDKNIAKEHLTKIYDLMISMNTAIDDNLTLQGLNNSEAEELNNSAGNDEPVIEDDFELFILNNNETAVPLGSNSFPTQAPIQLLLESFDNISREHYKTNIVEYWKQQQKSMPELYRLAQVLLAVPATQVSVERSFSSLKFILSDLRTNMTETILEDVMIIRGNKQFKK
ncbi:unnamed protein product [Macrosiphum euphorbiae]|uniref:HAT C-terminal dimerisation domain-containing protein n=1 Tax=Macrosiphum euphorbiae TaxID=13131 RepID=A0AAV0WFA3_9HEMI|nr:unnamed protein product [Macrosiphum euphorbiae]